MPDSLENKLVVAVTSRALFELSTAHSIFEKRGLKEYKAFQQKNEDTPLEAGTGLPLIKALLNINEKAGEDLVEVILLSRNDADSGLRIINSIDLSNLDISRMAFTGGTPHAVYLEAFSCDLLLSANPVDVRDAIQAGFAAALVYPPPSMLELDEEQVRIAFDGDNVLFGGASEEIYQQDGIDAFQEHEVAFENTPLDPGPLKGFLEALSHIQKKFPEGHSPIRTALVTSRGAPAETRVIKTLRAWNISLDESFFLDGLGKSQILQAFKPHIFFDDQKVHLETASPTTPSAQVPSEENST